MKKLRSIILSLLAALPVCAQQQTDSFSELTSMSVKEYKNAKKERIWQSYPKMEVRVGYSAFPLVDMLIFGLNEVGPIIEPKPENGAGLLEDMYTPYEGAVYMTGPVSVEFSYHLEKWFSIAGGLYFNGIYSSMIDPVTDQKVSRKSGLSLTVLPVARFYWANFEKCRLYSSVGLGVTSAGYEDMTYVIPAFQLSPFGVTAGKKVFFYAEAYSFGTQYIGGQLGVGYRF